MKIEQIYTGCLAQGAYYIQSENEAVVIDPLREVEPYLQMAKKYNATIRYVFETHFHADFVSGHIDLSARSGAPIVFGPNASPNFPAIIAADGDEFQVGRVLFKVIHTPGHTLESTCYLLHDENGKPVALFSGDTLFIGDTGRPDLAQQSGNLSMENLAGMLYDSLRNKIMCLPDDVIIYPAHGAGSACGKNMSRETSDTLGNQKKLNYALRSGMSKTEFVREVTADLAAPPAYFPLNVMLNKTGYESIGEVIRRGNRPLPPAEFVNVAQATNALILDTRDARQFAKGFIPGSINIGLDGSFAPWVGALLPGIDQKILVVAPEYREEETVSRLARVGYDQSLGYLAGGFASWKTTGRDIDSITSVSAAAFMDEVTRNKALIIDVRRPAEYNAGHFCGSVNLPLDNINDHPGQIDKNRTYYVHCAGGYRSMVFISILRARGYYNLIDVAGGYKAIMAKRTEAQK